MGARGHWGLGLEARSETRGRGRGERVGRRKFGDAANKRFEDRSLLSNSFVE